MSTTYTPNYNLGKQTDHADKFDMVVITENADKIDTALHNHDTELADLEAGKADKSTTYSLDVGTILASNSNLNTVTDLGTYTSKAAASDYTNIPSGADPTRAFRLIVMKDANRNICQIYDEFWTPNRWLRPCTTSFSWGPWVLIDCDLSTFYEKVEGTTDRAALVELVDKGAKNLIDAASGSGTRWTDITCNLPAGEYVLSFDELSTTWEAPTNNSIQIGFFNENYALVTSGYTYIDLDAKVMKVTTTDTAKVIRVYASPTNVTGKTVTYRNAMVCSKAAWDISQAYQPYRPSYQELYEMIQALQNGNSLSSVQSTAQLTSIDAGDNNADS